MKSQIAQFEIDFKLGLPRIFFINTRQYDRMVSGWKPGALT